MCTCFSKRSFGFPWKVANSYWKSNWAWVGYKLVLILNEDVNNYTNNL